MATISSVVAQYRRSRPRNSRLPRGTALGALATAGRRLARRARRGRRPRRGGDLARHGRPHLARIAASSHARPRVRVCAAVRVPTRAGRPRSEATRMHRPGRYGAPTMDGRLAGALVFVASGAVLVLEILAGRLLAPYVGVSLETFTGIIGVVLAGIAVGTWIGGRLADRTTRWPLLPVALTLGGAAAIAAVPIIRALGPSADGSNPPTIVFLAAVAFFLPSALLSAVTPLVVKLQLRTVDHTGRVVGRLSALGTAGSLVGVFGTGFILVAQFPTTPVVIALGGAAGADRRRDLWPAAARARALRLDDRRRRRRRRARRRHDACWPATRATSRRPTSAPACATTRSGPQAGSSCSTTCATPTSTSTTRRTSSSPTPSCSATSSTPLRPAGERIDAVHVGGGGFTMPRYLEATRPGSDSVVLELDPGVVELAEDELGAALRPAAAGADRRRQTATSPSFRADVGRSRHRRRLRWPGRPLAPGDAGVRRRDLPGAARRRHLRPERHRPAAAALPRRRGGDAARRVRPRRRDRPARRGSTARRAATRSSSPATRRCRSTPSAPRSRLGVMTTSS